MGSTISTQQLDRLAIGLSGVCLVHCLATAVLLGMLSAAGGLLGSAMIHEVGLVLAMIMGAMALGRGILDHGYSMPSAVGGLGPIPATRCSTSPASWTRPAPSGSST